jgi:hypothetical protein
VEALEQLVADAQNAGNVYFYYTAMVLRANLATLRAWPDPDLPEPARALAASGFDPGFLQVSLLQHRIRRGGDLRAEARAWVERIPDTVGLHVIARSVAAQATLVAGDLEGAMDEAIAAIRVAGELGLQFLLEADARQILCEVLLLAGRRAQLAQAPGRLLAMAEAAGSLRFTSEARLLSLGATDAAPPPAVLEELANQSHAAPVASRRAQALLGGTRRLDVLDRRILEALQSQGDGWRAVRLRGPESPADAWVPGWGLDVTRREVWLPVGRVVRFSRTPVLWRVLETIADLAGSATQEQIVQQVWGEPVFHPLRHRSRLHTTVNKVRHAIEDQPDAPVRLITTGQGYRFGDAEPVRVLVKPK